MHWPAALYTLTLWMLLASMWHVVRPLPESSTHLAVVSRLARDVLPAILLAVLIGRLV